MLTFDPLISNHSDTAFTVSAAGHFAKLRSLALAICPSLLSDYLFPTRQAIKKRLDPERTKPLHELLLPLSHRLG
jgi:hypothetical protein